MVIGRRPRHATQVVVLGVTKHGPDPLQPPPHPAKVDPGSGVATSATVYDGGKDAVQVSPQSMPAGVEVTRPRPPPIFATTTGRGSPPPPVEITNDCSVAKGDPAKLVSSACTAQ